MDSSAHLILGGAKSGKSKYAENRATNTGLEKIYLATSQVFDAEMETRIADHKTQRGPGWTTIEEPLALIETLQNNTSPTSVVLVDCLTLWLTNLMLDDTKDVRSEIDTLVAALPFAGPVIFVSNEVGQGIVPDNKMARQFRDYAGLLHQKLANKVDTVTFVTAGLPQRLKG